jgi:hypothetical protein
MSWVIEKPSDKFKLGLTQLKGVIPKGVIPSEARNLYGCRKDSSRKNTARNDISGQLRNSYKFSALSGVPRALRGT